MNPISPGLPAAKATGSSSLALISGSVPSATLLPFVPFVKPYVAFVFNLKLLKHKG